MNSPIHHFLHAVRARLNRSLALRSILAAALTTALAAIVWALAWRAFGYAAPHLGYAIITAAVLLGFAIHFLLRRRTISHSAAFADRHFHLKDALTSFLDFNARPAHEAPVYQLQQHAVESALADKSPRAIPLAIRPRRVWLALALTLAAVGLALLPHSPAVQHKLSDQQVTLDRSTQIQAELEKAVEEVISQLTEEERELLKPETLRAWVKELDPTKDQRDLMKQIARFEQKVSASLTGLEARKDEEVLKLAAAELDESQLSDAKQLAKKLDNKEFEEAKKQLSELKPEANQKQLTPEEMKKLLEKSAKLKELSRRMANGARKRDFGKAKARDLPNADADAKEMDELLGDLEQAANAADEDLQNLDPADKPDAGKLEKLDAKVGQLGQRLGKLGAKNKARDRMKALGKCAGQAQQFASGQAQSLGLGQQMAQLGGLKPGTGHSDAKRKEQDAAKDNQNFAQLNGQHGEGESKSATESADSGSGTASRSASEKSRDFRKQAESLVHRDDVPENLKQGIREYFERVHETETGK